MNFSLVYNIVGVPRRHSGKMDTCFEFLNLENFEFFNTYPSFERNMHEEVFFFFFFSSFKICECFVISPLEFYSLLSLDSFKDPNSKTSSLKGLEKGGF